MRLKTFGICSALALALAIPLFAQDSGQVIPEVKFDKVNLAVALDRLLMTREGSYVVRPGIEGTITLQAANKPVGVVLQSIAAQAGATVIQRNGIYEFLRKGDQPAFEDPGAAVFPAFHLERITLRGALKALFSGVNVSYAIDASVDGMVTLSLRQQPMETILRNILNQVDATYRIEAGIYQIVRREMQADPHPDVVVTRPTGVSVAFQGIPLREALKHLDIEYTIDPAVQGDVTMVAENKPLEVVLQMLLSQLKATYRVEGGIYNILPLTPAVTEQKATSSAGSMMIDGKFLYVLRGNQLVKLDKETLQILAVTELPSPGK